jgi:hypothetical protein
MLFAFVAIPHVVFVKDLSFLELAEAVLNGNSTLLISLRVSTTTIDSLALLHTRQVLDEVLVESISKADVKDEVMLTSIVTVETNIIINARFVQHV